MVRLRVPARSARPGPPLAPVLGQHQIKVADFAVQFNALTQGYPEGLPLGCRVHKRGGGKFTLTVLPPATSLVLAGLPTRGAPDLWAALAYRVGRVPTPGDLRTLLGTLRSCRRLRLN